MAATGRSVLGTVLVLISLALLVAGWRLTENDRYFLLHASQATGEVVAHEFSRREAPPGALPIMAEPKSLNGTVRARFRLVVSFKTPSGDRIRFRSISSYGRPPYAVGEKVGVRYDPAQPTRARVDRRIELLAPVLIWMGGVVLLGALGVAIAIWGPSSASDTSRVRRAPSPSR
jgi:hypothetical protein